MATGAVTRRDVVKEVKGRLLWMTDTFEDRNGVSTVLRAVLEEVRQHDLPVDLMVCSNTLREEDHLKVVRPLTEFTLPLYRQQPFRIPNYFAVRRTFREGGYTSIICSTEGPMGMAALWLKKVFSARAYFYLHTDWITFAREVLKFEETGLRRIERMLKAYYRRFGSIFVLNTEQRDWLTGPAMGFDPSKIFLTAHWAAPVFSDILNAPRHEFPFTRKNPVILYAGRISKEKGVMEIPHILGRARQEFGDVQIVVAGTGPAEEELKQAMPDAVYLGWVEQQYLPALYMAADLFLLPSRFDTFSCAVLEALSCGLPVLAYNTKGPRDILVDSECGFLADTSEEMTDRLNWFLRHPERHCRMKEAAFHRASRYRADEIMERLLRDTGMKLNQNFHEEAAR